MKRIEIPTKSQNVDELSNSQILIQNNSFFIDSIKTFEISDLYEKILKHEAFTKDELIYLYDIYIKKLDYCLVFISYYFFLLIVPFFHFVIILNLFQD